MSEPVEFQACRLRVTRLDATGAPVTGVVHVTDAQLAVSVEPVYLPGTPLVERDIHGNVVVNRPGTSQLAKAAFALTVIGAHPGLAEVLVGASALEGGGLLGPVVNAAPPEDGASVEVWTRRIVDGQPAVDIPYSWWVYPKVVDVQLRPWQHTSGALMWTFAGTVEANDAWGAGPDGTFAHDLGGRLFAAVPAATMPA